MYLYSRRRHLTAVIKNVTDRGHLLSSHFGSEFNNTVHWSSLRLALGGSVALVSRPLILQPT